jgi:hypothetical protein
MTILFDNGHFVYKLPHVCGVMVSVLASNVVVCGVPLSDPTKTIKLVFSASRLST